MPLGSMLSRRELLTASALLATATQAGGTDLPVGGDDGLRLLSLPTRVYKSSDAGRESNESWVCWIFVETSALRQLVASRLRVTARSGQRRVQTVESEGDGIAQLALAPPIANKLVDGSAATTPTFWPLAVRVRGTAPIAAAVDSLQVELVMKEGERLIRADLRVPIAAYRQKTALIYPFRGCGLITQAGTINGGHRNRSGQFALDAMGLDDHYGVYPGRRQERNQDYAGWGRKLIAPAAGVIVRARSDRPDQPLPEQSDPKFYAPEYPNGGDPGNHLIIDHGNGEFSMLAHLQAGSLRVQLGDRVASGQALGRLGNSGDTNAPHLHYQLQSGPDWEWSDALPAAFSNVDAPALVRGVFFRAR